MQAAESPLSCKDVDGLLPLFLDGELDARQMRAVALHGSRCLECENEIRSLERLHVLIKSTVEEQLEAVDFSHFWNDLSAKLPPKRLSWATRLRSRWGDAEGFRFNPYVGLAAAAAAAALGFLLLNTPTTPTVQPAAQQVASQEDPASIDSLSSDVSSVAVVNDPETSTAVLWVSDDTVVDDGANR